MKIENCIIKSTMLGSEDHGIFTCFVMVEGSGWGCGFGGFAFDGWDEKRKERWTVSGAGIEFIKGILRVVGVSKWESLPGQHCRVETEGLGGGIKRIGNIIKEDWFDPKALFAEFSK